MGLLPLENLKNKNLGAHLGEQGWTRAGRISGGDKSVTYGNDGNVTKRHVAVAWLSRAFISQNTHIPRVRNILWHAIRASLMSPYVLLRDALYGARKGLTVD